MPKQKNSARSRTVSVWKAGRFTRQGHGKEYDMLETERLLLRKWTEEDADSLFEYAKDPEVGRTGQERKVWMAEREKNCGKV